MTVNRKLPDFIVIGAGKAGTTSLYHYLCQHPDIYMSPIKETKFFACNGIPHKNCLTGHGIPFPIVINEISQYQELFSPAAPGKIKGEVSPQYLSSTKSAEQMSKIVPNVKLIAILRNPVDRAISSYKMRVERGTEILSLRDAVQEDIDGRRSHWIGGRIFTQGLYSEAIVNYLNHFHKNKLKVILYDDYLKNPSLVMSEVFEFIGVQGYEKIDFSVRKNTSKDRVKKRRRYHGVITLAQLLRRRRAIPYQLIYNLLRYDFSRKSKLTHLITEGDRFWLAAQYADEIEKLEKLLHRDLSDWKVDFS